MLGGDDPIIAMIKSKKKAAHAGPPDQLKPIESDLFHAIFELCEQGVQVKILLVVVKALSLSPAFNAKSFTARCSTAKCFMHAHSFVYQMGMHESQHKPEEVEGGMKDCMHLYTPICQWQSS